VKALVPPDDRPFVWCNFAGDPDGLADAAAYVTRLGAAWCAAFGNA
jgi:hypothetical protein